jgi:Ala-tRNA(Pro) deacylase
MAISTDHGVACVMRFLEEAGAPFEVVEHEPTFTAADDARAAHAELAFTAKTLALHDRDGWRIAVLPASHRLDLEKARRLLSGTRHLRLGSEEEMADAFPAFDVGALPPVGPQLPLPEVVDVRLLYRRAILCPSGDHRHGLRMDARDLVRLAEPRVGDICAYESRPRRKDSAYLPNP